MRGGGGGTFASFAGVRGRRRHHALLAALVLLALCSLVWQREAAAAASTSEGARPQPRAAKEAASSRLPAEDGRLPSHQTPPPSPAPPAEYVLLHAPHTSVGSPVLHVVLDGGPEKGAGEGEGSGSGSGDELLRAFAHDLPDFSMVVVTDGTRGAAIHRIRPSVGVVVWSRPPPAAGSRGGGGGLGPDFVSVLRGYLGALGAADLRPAYVATSARGVAGGDVEAFASAAADTLEADGALRVAGCRLLLHGAGRTGLVAFGVAPVSGTGDVPALQQNLLGYPAGYAGAAAAVRSQLLLAAPHCAVFRVADVAPLESLESAVAVVAAATAARPAGDGDGSNGVRDFYAASVLSAQVLLNGATVLLPLPVRYDPSAAGGDGVSADGDDVVSPRVAAHLLNADSAGGGGAAADANAPPGLLRAALLMRIHRSREVRVKAALGADASMLGVELFWDTFCSCTGVNVEAISYLSSLDSYLQVRAVADEACWCGGNPKGLQQTLLRLTKPKGLDAAVRSAIPARDRVRVWVSHKPPEHYPSFPYRGVINYDPRPDYVIGRSMVETDSIPRQWAAQALSPRNKKTRVDELWVPSTFVRHAFEAAGVAHVPITVVPECIDVSLFSPDATAEVYPGLPSVDDKDAFSFFSNFKWEARKGWELLLRAFFEVFSRGGELNKHGDVSLVLKTHLYMEHDAHNPDKVTRKISEWARRAGFNMREIPAVHVVAEEVPAEQMPSLYRGVHCFVLPTRGEGWGLGMHEAMSMGLPTIATNWGGNTEFMTEETSLLIKVNGTEPAPSGFAGRWAVPDVEDLKAKMRWVYENQDEAVLLGKRARKHIVANFSQEAVAPLILRRLHDIRKKVSTERG